MNTDAKTWLNIYLEHARHYVHEPEPSSKVVAHLWHVAWREGWSVLVEYLRQHTDVKMLRDIDQWALNMCLLPQALEAYALWGEATWWGQKHHNPTKPQVQFVGKGINLSWANFSDADLSFAEFENANRCGANFENAELYETNLENANLTETNLENVELMGVNLCGANLTSAKLGGADSCSVRLTGATLRGADLIGTDLRGTIGFGSVGLKDAKYNSQTKWPDNFDPTDPDHGLILIED